MKRITVIDNYDSFVYNLVRYLKEAGCIVDVKRNNQLNFTEINDSDGILLSPGPGIPSEAGRLLEVIEAFGSTKKILGVCLGHQAISEVYGGTIVQSEKAIHGKSSTLIHDNSSSLFTEIPTNFSAGRYHSWHVDKVPSNFNITAKTEDGINMAMEHNELPVYGVQFHPESILTPTGRQIITNWLNQ
ncbi:MAG: anthranilate synthase component 2 [Flavobacteriaceae bacterium]|jgi:anthranilate synthase component 2